MMKTGGKKAPTIPTVMGNGDPKTVYGPNLGAWVGLPVMTDDYESIAAKVSLKSHLFFEDLTSNTLLPRFSPGFVSVNLIHTSYSICGQSTRERSPFSSYFANQAPTV